MGMLKPIPCPAGKCDAQLWAAGEFVFCPRCNARNPNFHNILAHLEDKAKRASPPIVRLKKEPEIDWETGVIKW